MKTSFLALSALSLLLYACQRQNDPDDTEIDLLIAEPEMIFVQGGTFTMGCTDEQGDDCYKYEHPAHDVTLSNFYIGKFEITQKQWKAVMGENPSIHKVDNLPVTNVNWNDTQKFINKLNKATGKKYRLPTEAEWEYAARGGNKSKGYKYSGSDNLDDVAWHRGNSDEVMHPVGTKQPNEIGIYDMTGNVWEWCNDWEHEYSSEAQINPQGPSESTYRKMIRGGSWSSVARYNRVAMRNFYSRSHSEHNAGFRVALTH